MRCVLASSNQGDGDVYAFAHLRLCYTRLHVSGNGRALWMVRMSMGQVNSDVAWLDADQQRAAPSKSTGKWADEYVARLNMLWAEGVSCSGISNVLRAEFGVHFSRNAIIGKIHRLGLPGRATMPKEGAPRRSKLFPDRVFKPSKSTRKPPLDFSEYQSPTVEVVPLGIKFMDVKDDQCRYVIGEADGLNTLFCGNPVIGELSWCAGHCRICFDSARRSNNPYRVRNLHRPKTVLQSSNLLNPIDRDERGEAA